MIVLIVLFSVKTGQLLSVAAWEAFGSLSLKQLTHLDSLAGQEEAL